MDYDSQDWNNIKPKDESYNFKRLMDGPNSIHHIPVEIVLLSLTLVNEIYMIFQIVSHVTDSIAEILTNRFEAGVHFSDCDNL